MILIQAVFLPIILAPFAYLLGKRIGSRVGWFSFAILFYSTILVLLSSSSGDYLEEYNWQPIGTFGLHLDGLSAPFAATIYILSTVLAVYSIPYMTHRIEEEIDDLEPEEAHRVFNKKFGMYFMYYMLYASGMLGTVLATNLIQFYIFFEIMLVPSFFLIAQFGYGDRVKISVMYFLWTHIGALIFLAGILTLGFFAGTFDINSINTSAIGENVRIWIALAVTVGLSVKLAAFGLHIWLPHAHAEAPTPISALLSPAMIGIGAYALVRILIFLLPSAYKEISLALSVWGLITMIYGGWMALNQDDIKRLLAYSSISQMGYIIFGLSSAYYIGVSGAIFQYVSHGMGKAILFMAVGSVILQTHGIRSISKLGGLASRLPITATAALIGFLTIIGVPPMSGFQSEWMIFYGSFAGAITIESTLKIIISAAALISTPLTAGYTLLAMKKIFYGRTPEHLQDVREASKTITIPLLFLAFLTILLGIYPDLINERIIHFMENILDS